MNQYSYDNERGLIVTHAPSKSLDDVKRVIASGRPQKGIDAAIAAYIPTLDPTQSIADAWYEQHLLVESNDHDEVFTRTYRDDNGDEQTETVDNPYTVARNARTKLENINEWLKGYRGKATNPRPEFTMTVDEFKTVNADLFVSHNKRKGTTIDGFTLSLDKDNTDGLLAIETAQRLAVEVGGSVFPVKFLANTPSGEQYHPFEDEAAFKSFALQFITARQEFFK